MNIFTFPRTARLKKARDFRSVFLKGRKTRAKFLILCVLKRTRAHGSRLGIVVSRQAVRKAAKRNRLKRLVREFFRKRRMFLCQDSDVVVRFLKGGGEFNEEEVIRILGELFERAGLGGKEHTR